MDYEATKISNSNPYKEPYNEQAAAASTTNTSFEMAAIDPNNPVIHDFFPYFRVYGDGTTERLMGTDILPPSLDPHTGVTSKDVVISPDSGLSARLYLPKLADPNQKLPLLVYFHGGGFCVGTPYCSLYHDFLNSLVAEANVVAVAVDYRLAPEHPLPAAYEDSWAALQWVASSSQGVEYGDAWLTDHVDFDRIFLAGDSAGANIAHNLAMKAGATELPYGVKLYGLALVHPYFWGSKRLGYELLNPVMAALPDRLWPLVCASADAGADDPRINPVAAGAPSLAGLRCESVLVCVAEKDILSDRGRLYYEALGESGWGGKVELVETQGKDHVFHILDPLCDEALPFMKRLAAFFNTCHGEHGAMLRKPARPAKY